MRLATVTVGTTDPTVINASTGTCIVQVIATNAGSNPLYFTFDGTLPTAASFLLPAGKAHVFEFPKTACGENVHQIWMLATGGSTTASYSIKEEA